MKVYNQDKTEVLMEYDLAKGHLERDKRIIHHDVVMPVEEKYHYEVVKEYENGGKDVEKVIDIEGVEGQAAYDEEEDIVVYIPYTEKELQRQKDETEYSELSQWFEWYDMQVNQYERTKRLGVEFDRDINALDAEAVEKAEQMRNVKDRLGVQ